MARVNARSLAIFVGAVLLAAVPVWLLLPGSSRATARGIVILGTQFTNGEQVVAFRLTPSDSEVTFADVVAVSDNGQVQPWTVRVAGEYVLPAQGPGNPPSLKLRHLSLPTQGSTIQGRPIAYTPGSYTVGYTPTAGVNRVRVGVALARSGWDDWKHRVQKTWRLEDAQCLLHKTHGDAVYITSEPITNGTPGGELSR